MALDSIILLFNFIHDKDLFHRCYARLLAHRIITFSSVSDDAEKRMMRHLRTVCGYQYAMTFQVRARYHLPRTAYHPTTRVGRSYVLIRDPVRQQQQWWGH